MNRGIISLIKKEADGEYCMNCCKPLEYKKILGVGNVTLTLCDDCVKNIYLVLKGHLEVQTRL